MKHLQGTPLWRADTTFLKAIKVTVKDSTKQLDSEDQKIQAHTHFLDEFSAWKQLQVVMDARHQSSEEHKLYTEEKAVRAGRELAATRHDYVVFLNNLKTAGFNI